MNIKRKTERNVKRKRKTERERKKKINIHFGHEIITN